jgi:hypothetical protein
MDRYAHCGNEPLRFTDPTGQMMWVGGGGEGGGTTPTLLTSPSDDVNWYTWVQLSVGYSKDSEGAEAGADAGLFIILDTSSAEKVGDTYYCHAWVYVEGEASLGSSSPCLQGVHIPVGDFVDIGVGVLLADMSNPRALNGWTPLSGPLGVDPSQNPVVSISPSTSLNSQYLYYLCSGTAWFGFSGKGISIGIWPDVLNLAAWAEV